MFKHRIGSINFVIVKSTVSKEKSDVLFNWTISDLSGGDDNFMEIHREGGSVIYKECQGALAQYGRKIEDGTKAINVGEAVLTSAGILFYHKIVHCIVPNYRVKEEKENKNSLFLSTINYSLALLNSYSKTHRVIRKIVITPLPERICGTFDKNMVDLFTKTLINNAQSFGFREVKLVCKTDEEVELYKKTFTSKYVSFSDKLYNWLFS
jgi:O-acetyl-ADP-ribose deacetylase (regulator of RNase III)